MLHAATSQLLEWILNENKWGEKYLKWAVEEDHRDAPIDWADRPLRCPYTTYSTQHQQQQQLSARQQQQLAPNASSSQQPLEFVKNFFSILTFDFKQYQVKFTYWQGNNNNNCCCCCCNSTKQHWEQHWKRRTHAKNDRYFDGSTASGSTATLLFSPRLPTKATPAESPRASFCSLSLSLSVHRRR